MGRMQQICLVNPYLLDSQKNLKTSFNFFRWLAIQSSLSHFECYVIKNWKFFLKVEMHWTEKFKPLKWQNYLPLLPINISPL